VKGRNFPGTPACETGKILPMRRLALSRMPGFRQALNGLALMLGLTAVTAQAVAPICLYNTFVRRHFDCPVHGAWI